MEISALWPIVELAEWLPMFFRKLCGFVVWLLLALTVIWATAALYFDFPVQKLRIWLAVAFVLLVAGILIRVRSRTLVIGLCFGLFAIVVAWWLRLQPSNDRPWLRDVAQTPWAEVQGDKAVIHNVRNFDYITETDYKVNWETRTVDLSQIRAVDLFMNH